MNRGTLRPVGLRQPSPHNLPRELTSFVGRQRELTELEQQLVGNRAVTLVGAGGAGKTRLALRFAAGLRERGTYPEGVWLVELGQVSDTAFVPRAVAAVLGVVEKPEVRLLDSLVETIVPWRMLFVLDNCEHLVEACAETAEALLRSCDHIHIVATSREPLGISGEVVVRVQPLSLPTGDGQQELLSSEAGTLFVDRARAAEPSFRVSDTNAAAIANLCRRLDGLPLALELTAARVAALSVHDLAARMEDSFALVAAHRRTGPPRHQTLQAAITWSYGLLASDEQHLFERLSVFAGGFGLDAAESVGDDYAVDVLARLVDRSVVQAEPQPDGSMRYRLLEPLRDVARERLVERDDLRLARRRHFVYVLALADRAKREWFGPNQAAWLRRMDVEWDNVRAALDWTIETGDLEGTLRLADPALWPRPQTMAECRARLAQVLAMPGVEAHGLLHARVQGALAWTSMLLGDIGVATALVDQALPIARKHADTTLVMLQLGVLGSIHLFRGETDRAEAVFTEGMTVCRSAGLRSFQALALERLADVALARGDVVAAEARIREALNVAREAGDAWSLAMALNALGDVLRSRGDHEQAGAAYNEALPIFTALHPRGEPPPGTVHNLGYVAIGKGEPHRAGRLFLQSADLYRRQGPDWRGMAECVMGLAASALSAGLPELSARLFGAAEAALERLGTTFTPTNRADYERSLAGLSRLLDAEQCATEWAAGRVLTVDEALGSARAALDEAQSHKDAIGLPRKHQVLTAREREIGALVARGLTNRQIAAELVISERTAANHVQHVLDKFGISSRAQLAARADEFGLAKP